MFCPYSPCAVAATGINHVTGGTENLAYLTMFFEDNVIAHVNVNWLSPVKIRRTLIGGSKQMIVYDDMEPSEKVKVYDKGITVNTSTDSLYKALVGYRSGDMFAPQLDVSEALKIEMASTSRNASSTGRNPITGGRAGLQVVRILESASISMQPTRQISGTRSRFPGCVPRSGITWPSLPQSFRKKLSKVYPSLDGAGDAAGVYADRSRR